MVNKQSARYKNFALSTVSATLVEYAIAPEVNVQEGTDVKVDHTSKLAVSTLADAYMIKRALLHQVKH